ncbi:MAG: phosphohistidine phosphatase SixA [bacterium]
MKVYLIRHGHAKSSDEDPQKPLSHVGRETIKKVSPSALKLGMNIEKIWHSTKLRAKETAIIVADFFEGRVELIERKGLAPNDEVRPIAHQLVKRDENIAIVGHLPFLNRLASLLLCGSEHANIVHFNPGTIICLIRDETNNWSIEWGINADIGK